MTSPLSPIRRDDALALWSAYSAGRPDPAPPEEEPWIGRFGDSAAMADELVGPVLAGIKRATAGLVLDHALEGEPLPRVGGHVIPCDAAGAPQAVLRTIELRLGALESVDDAFAWDEGEGDRTRAGWLAGHRAYFRRSLAGRGLQWSEDLEVVFERFHVVWPPDIADQRSAAPELT